MSFFFKKKINKTDLEVSGLERPCGVPSINKQLTFQRSAGYRFFDVFQMRTNVCER